MRDERLGLGVSAAGHVALLGVLSLGWFVAPKPLIVPQTAVDVSLVDEVGLEAAVPEAVEVPPAPSVAPEVGPPEPEVTKPEPSAVPPKPEAVAPSKPAPVAKAQSKPAPAKPKPASVTKLIAKPATPPRGSRLGPDFLKGIGDTPSTSTSQTPRVANVGPREMAGLSEAIKRQVQPCADRITSPGPGSNSISTKLNLRLNRDGSFAVRPEVLSQSGVNDENRRYAKRVSELAAAAFVQCAPFTLPDALYDGWKNFNLNYKLPD